MYKVALTAAAPVGRGRDLVVPLGRASSSALWRSCRITAVCSYSTAVVLVEEKSKAFALTCAGSLEGSYFSKKLISVKSRFPVWAVTLLSV